MKPLRRAQPWLGTKVEIGITDAPAANTATAFAAAFAAVARVHQAMSPQLADSDLARFNAAAIGAVIECHTDTLDVLEAAAALAASPDSGFDASLGTGGNAGWSLSNGGLHKLHGAARLDLGGIAKGHAVDLAIAALQSAGVNSGWVDAGGDLRVFGALELPIHIRSLADAACSLPLISLQDGALATSVLPLATGGTTHISVATPLCLWADALTKVVAYGSAARCAALLARYHARAWRHPAF